MLRSLVHLTPKLNQISLTRKLSSIVPKNLTPFELAIGNIINTVCFPLQIVGSGIIKVEPKYVYVSTYLGKYTGVHYYEGTTWIWNPIGMDLGKVFIGESSMKIKDSKIIDKIGNPVIVSGIMNYNVVHPERYALGFVDPVDYIYNQTDAILKKVIGQHSYYELRSSDSNIRDELIEKSQEVLDVVGLHVSDFKLTDMNYAKEIAQSMLLKQQAIAYTDAKKYITEASSDIISEIISKYDNILDDKDKADLIKNLLIVITSGSSVQPTISVN